MHTSDLNDCTEPHGDAKAYYVQIISWMVWLMYFPLKNVMIKQLPDVVQNIAFLR